MKIQRKMREFAKDKKAVFGLTSVQQFFGIILGLALLAYVIVVIMGTLQSSTLLTQSTQSQMAVNESGQLSTPHTLLNSNKSGFSSPAIVTIINTTDGNIITVGNFTLTGNVLSNATFNASSFNTIRITYTYNINTQTVNNANTILANTSTGITSFFASINPVYAILAILVIILVLVVLVRVVTSSTGGGMSGGSPGSPL